MTIPTTEKAIPVGVDLPPRSRGERSRRPQCERECDEDSRPRRARRGAPPCRGRRDGSGPRVARPHPTAKNVSRAATRSVPECAASDSSPRLPEWHARANLQPDERERGDDRDERCPSLRRHGHSVPARLAILPEMVSRPAPTPPTSRLPPLRQAVRGSAPEWRVRPASGLQVPSLSPLRRLRGPRSRTGSRRCR